MLAVLAPPAETLPFNTPTCANLADVGPAKSQGQLLLGSGNEGSDLSPIRPVVNVRSMKPPGRGAEVQERSRRKRIQTPAARECMPS